MKQAVNMRRFQPAEDLAAIALAPAGRCARHDPLTADVIIHTIRPSLCSQRVRMTLLEKHVPYTERLLNTAAGENLEPDYIALNPRALVPTMTFDDRVLFDSATIMRFINNWFEGPELAPFDSAGFEAMNRWIDRSDDFPIRGFTYRAQIASGQAHFWKTALHDNIVRYRDRYPEHREIYDLKLADWADLVAWIDSPRDLSAGEAIAETLADDAEAALAEGDYLVGASLTLADITTFILLMRLQCGCGLRLWGPALRPNLQRYIQALKQRVSYDGAVLAHYRIMGAAEWTGDCWFPATGANFDSPQDVRRL
ncbi:MAG TPA: glutathione S-transferase family protein [Caulobacteraceae bacterium]|jgi:glutathione S-transferase|nr:glutathione S-transferase family protein [Caulobacteraceae bacterium]